MQAELLLRQAGARATRVRLQALGALIRLGHPISQPDRARLPRIDVPPDIQVQGRQLVVYGLCAARTAAGEEACR